MDTVSKQEKFVKKIISILFLKKLLSFDRTLSIYILGLTSPPPRTKSVEPPPLARERASYSELFSNRGLQSVPPSVKSPMRCLEKSTVIVNEKRIRGK